MTKILAYLDGGSRGNPGPAAIGVAIFSEKNQLLKKYSEHIGNATNNEAEYRSVIFSLEKIKKLFGKKKIENMRLEIYTDSELLAQQLNGRYKILDSDIQALFLKAWNLKVDYGQVRFNLIPREQNQLADSLVNQALDAAEKEQRLF